ncbi:MAG: 50S ribosomal protein L23 [Candidatus Ryanbacteria bacterium]|nr:50S ribosomal protein L23 [Candidatus Ryanbacteria bacterium]
MALFDFLKRKKAQEKQDERKAEREIEHEERAEQKQDHAHAVVHGSVLVAPHVTERARDLSQLGQYTFRVRESATKHDVRASVEKMYGVHVEGVRMVSGHEKPRRRGLTWGTKKGYKKAIVSLKSGETIDII